MTAGSAGIEVTAEGTTEAAAVVSGTAALGSAEGAEVAAGVSAASVAAIESGQFITQKISFATPSPDPTYLHRQP